MKNKTDTSPKATTKNFISFILQKEQKINSIIFLSTYILIYIFISYCYPYADITADTGNYILHAKTMTISGYRPIGYSLFLHFSHLFGHSVHFLFFAQYLFNAIVSLFFIFTVKYFFPSLKKGIFYILAGLIIIEPNTIYVSNMIMSDSVFSSLTLLFITSLFWFRKGNSFIVNFLIVILNTIILSFAFSVRYTALFYAIVSSVFFLVANKNKLIGIGLALLPIMVVVHNYQNTKEKMKKAVGIETFSGFSGWALANNAVSVIPYVDLKPEDIKNSNLKFVHSIVSQYPDSTYSAKHIIATSFMWKKEFPGKQILYRIINFKKMSYPNAWVYTGDLFKEYGKMLITKYPLRFFKHFVLVNFKQLFKYFKIPNPSVYKPDQLQKEWFELNIDKYEYKYNFFSSINPFMKVFHYIRWILFVGGLSYLIYYLKRLTFTTQQKMILITAFVFIICFFGFSILSHPINNFRYLIPTYPFMIFFPYIAIIQYQKLSKNKTSE